MKVIILLAGYGKRMRPHTWSRPKPLLKMAGNTVIGHILDIMHEITGEEVIFVVGYKGDQIEAWIRRNYPELNVHFVVQEEALGQAHALWLCRDHLDDGDVVLAFGDGIFDIDYANFANPDADAVLLVKEVVDPRRFGVVVLDEGGYVTRLIEKPDTKEHKLAIAGAMWFRSGLQLYDAVDNIIKEGRQTLGEYFMVDAYQVLLERGAKIRTMTFDHWTDAGTPQAILSTNAYLLAYGDASHGSLERGLEEGFVVLPPVYIHPSAVIEAAVIGPNVSIDAGVRITNAVVKNGIIDQGAQIANCVLENILVGEGAKVSGQSKAIFVGDNAKVEF